MTSFPVNSRLLVPFGTKDWAQDRVSISQDKNDDPVFDCPVSHVVLEIAAKQGLRLNSDWYRMYEQPPLQELHTAADRYSFITEHMPIYCDVWDKYQQLFLDGYFEFVWRLIRENRAELNEKIAGMDSLYSLDDWLFSAFLPVPQAILYAPEEPSEELYLNEDMVRVPLLFWTGVEVFAVFFTGINSHSSRVKTLYDRLKKNGFSILEIEQRSLTHSPDFSFYLPEIFSRFWLDEVVPAGPFQSTLTDPEN